MTGSDDTSDPRFGRGPDERRARPTLGLDHVQWTDQPSLVRPVVLAAFEGWNDAGDAATTAVRTLASTWKAESFASIDPEIFYDFTTTRPHVRLNDEGEREIVWPENLFAGARVHEGLHVITLIGSEPQLRWPTFCRQVVGVAEHFDARLVVTLGALLAEVPHTRATPVYGAGYEDDASVELGLMPSRYEGPTGIVGVLHAACRDAGLRSASLWAAVPTYVPSVPSPKASLALLRRLASLLDISLIDVGNVALDALAEEALDYERQISEVADDDEETTEYVHRLEAAYDEDEGLLDESGSLVDEVERFLREQRD
jgi:predicted ATP-grasp superfamily ATP-dependent carboligase